MANLFLDLKLSPDATTDDEFKKALSSAISRWNKQIINSPSKAQNARLNLGRKDKYIDDWHNLDVRKAQAKTAKEERRSQIKAANEDLNINLEFLVLKGHYSKVDLKKMVRKFEGTFDEATLIDRLSQSGLRQDTKTKKKPKAKPLVGMESTTYNNLTTSLELLNFKTLYGFLGVSKTARLRISTANLKRMTDVAYTEVMTKFDSAADTRKIVLGEAKIVFANNENREKYDVSVSTDILSSVEPLIDLVSPNKFITHKAYDKAVAQCIKLGVSKTLADQFVNSYCISKNIVMQPSSSSTTQKLIICPNCAAATSDNRRKKCSECATALYLSCPGCSTTTPAADKICGKCQFPTGNRPLVDALIADIETELGQSKPKAALAILENADSSLKDWPDLAESRKKILGLQSDYERSLKAMQSLRHDKKMVELSGFMGKSCLKPSRDYPQLDSLTEAGNDAIVRVKRIIKEAKRLRGQGKIDEAISKLQTASKLAVDLPDSLEILKSIPPPLASQATAKQNGKSCEVTWKAPKSVHAHMFKVFRENKTGGQIEVGRTDKSHLSDSSTPLGEAYRYSIVTLRKEVASKGSARTPYYLKTESVNTAKFKPNDGAVSFNWKLPIGASSATLFRHTGTDKAAATQVYSGPNTSFNDKAVTNGQTYHYWLQANYPDPNSTTAIICGPYKQFEATPVQPARPVNDLTANVINNKLELTWSPNTIDFSQVTFVLTKRGALEAQFKEQVILSDFVKKGRVLGRKSKCPLRVPIPDCGQYDIIPISLTGKSGTIGRTTQFDNLGPVTNLSYNKSTKGFLLRWDWPKGTVSAFIRGRSLHALSGNLILSDDVRKRRNDKKGTYTIPPNINGRIEFEVTAVYSDRSKAMPTTKSVWVGSETTLTYQVEALKKFGIVGPINTIQISAKVDHDIDLPKLMIVVKAGAVPTSQKDGTHIMTVAASRILKKNNVSIAIDRQFWNPNYFVGIFPFDSKVEGLNFKHPPAERLKLSG